MLQLPDKLRHLHLQHYLHLLRGGNLPAGQRQMQDLAHQLPANRQHHPQLQRWVVQAMLLWLYPAVRQLLPVLKQLIQRNRYSIQLNLCFDYHCPNYYAQLKHESKLLVFLSTLILLYLLF